MRCNKNDGAGRAIGRQKAIGCRWHVFAGSFLALAIMTVVAAAGGRVLPLVLKQELRTIFMVSLLVFFGIKMLYEAVVYGESPEELGGEKHHTFFRCNIAALATQHNFFHSAFRPSRQLRRGSQCFSVESCSSIPS